MIWIKLKEWMEWNGMGWLLNVCNKKIKEMNTWNGRNEMNEWMSKLEWIKLMKQIE